MHVDNCSYAWLDYQLLHTKGLGYIDETILGSVNIVIVFVSAARTSGIVTKEIKMKVRGEKKKLISCIPIAQS